MARAALHRFKDRSLPDVKFWVGPFRSTYTVRNPTPSLQMESEVRPFGVKGYAALTAGAEG